MPIAFRRRPTLGFAAAGLIALVVALLGAPGGAALAAGRGEPGPVYPVEVMLRDRQADLAELTRMGIDVDAVFFDRARVYLVAEEQDKLRALGYDLAMIPPETLIPGVAATLPAGTLVPDIPPPPATDSHNTYHTWATLTSELQQIAGAYPNLTRLVSIGKSVQNRDLWMMKITANPAVEENEPEVHYIAAMHGDEVVGKEMCMDFIHLLTESYGTDPRITALLNTTEIWIMPSMNPDGTELHQRYNANGFDLNRSFPDQFNDPNNTPAGRPIEVQHVMAWGAAHRSNLSANFHGGSVVANYPWDGNAAGANVYTPSTQEGLFLSLARAYADNNPTMLASNSDASFNNGVCNGADWYVIYGGMQDWNYVWQGGHEVTLELTNVKWPQASTLPRHWDDNRESMLAYLERVHTGVGGTVTDAATGAPLQASVTVVGAGHATYTDPDLGDYHRPLVPGTYALEIASTGYATRVVPDVPVATGVETRRDAALVPLGVNLQYASHRVLDGAGGNGWLDAGEVADLPVTLRNMGSPGTGITGHLVPADFFGRVDCTSGAWPNLAAGASAESTAPQPCVSVTSGAPTGHKAGFAVAWSSAQGSGVSDAFFVPIGAPTCTTLASTGAPIPFGDRQTATSTITFPANLEISDVNVYVNVTHPFIGDLTITAISPSGAPILLHDRTGGSADNVVGWYDTQKTPAEPLSRLTGLASSGTWTLKVNDGVPANTGVLNSWSVEVCGRPFESTTPEIRVRDVLRAGAQTVLSWWPYPGLTSYTVYRSTSPAPGGFVNVTASDANPADTAFTDSAGGTQYYLVSGVGPAGEGPK